MSEWNPDLYLRFKQERTQPTRDLIYRIRKDYVDSIIDIGCGPGNSTIELKRRWRDAWIIGLDSSETMLERARADYPKLEWVHRDAGGDLSDLGAFDIVFSNAAIQLWETTAYALICAVAVTKSLHIADSFPAKEWTEVRKLSDLRFSATEKVLGIASVASLLVAAYVEAYLIHGLG